VAYSPFVRIDLALISAAVRRAEALQRLPAFKIPFIIYQLHSSKLLGESWLGLV
jgi:hypothetical protein